MEHAPGPRGSPHEPHGPAGAADLDELLADTANTESCGSNFFPRHFGHSAFSLPYTSASNWCWHSLQMYSKMGMGTLLPIKINLWGVRKFQNMREGRARRGLNPPRFAPADG